MKRISIFFAAATVVLAAGCQKGLENNAPEVSGEASEVVLTAMLPDTKTSLEDGYKVSWTQNDQIAVFNAKTGTTDYSANLHFCIDENAEGKFTAGEGTVVPFEDGVNYDWFVCSPWRSTGGKAELISPKGQSREDGYFPIGAQTQTGYNSSVHISSADVMVGKALDTRTPVVTLKHLAVLHKFTVTNSSDQPTIIKKLTFNGGENKIFGTFWIDMTADNPSIDINKANNTYNERALTVNDGTELAVGECADFYIITAPFTLNAGETFKVTIETSTGTQTVEKTATNDIEFAAGTYNTAALVYDFIPAPPVLANHLYEDTFNGTFENSSSVTTSNTTFTPGRWDTYDKGGMTVYDGNVSAVTYTHDSNSCLSKYVNGAVIGMDDLYIWFKTGGVVTISGIKLHDYTFLNLSFIQTYKASGIKAEYSVDGADWVEIGTTALENKAYAYNASYDFEVPIGSKTISLRFTAVTAAPRIDNIKLTWQEL